MPKYARVHIAATKNPKSGLIVRIQDDLGSSWRIQVLGSSCPTSLRPGHKPVNENFRIFPRKDSQGELVVIRLTSNSDQDDKTRDFGATAVIHVLPNDDGGYTAVMDPKVPHLFVAENVNFQLADRHFELEVNGIIYTNEPGQVVNPGDARIRHAQLNDMLEYIVSHVGLRELKRRSKLCAKRMDEIEWHKQESERRLLQIGRQQGQMLRDAGEIKVLTEQLNNARGELTKANDMIVGLGNTRDELAQKLAGAEAAIAELQEQLAKVRAVVAT